MFIFNWLGLAMFAVAMAVGVGVGNALGWRGEGR